MNVTGPRPTFFAAAVHPDMMWTLASVLSRLASKRIGFR